MSKMTATAAAELLNITPYSIYRLIKAGKLEGEKFGTVWMVDRASVEEFQARNEGKSQHDPTRE
jgi:excisionase family DNA binding protein